MDRSKETNSEGKTDRPQFQFFLTIVGMEVSKGDPKMFGFLRSFEPEELN